jgi:hypothetical protein
MRANGQPAAPAGGAGSGQPYAGSCRDESAQRRIRRRQRNRRLEEDEAELGLTFSNFTKILRCHGDLLFDTYEEDFACMQCGRHFGVAAVLASQATPVAAQTETREPALAA